MERCINGNINNKTRLRWSDVDFSAEINSNKHYFAYVRDKNNRAGKV